MQTLEEGVAFNSAYRLKWKEYLSSRTSLEVAKLTSRLTAGLDDESRALGEVQVNLVERFFPHPMLSETFYDESLKKNLLPKATRSHLRRAGYFDKLEEALDNIQGELDLPETPLPELFFESGLSYISKIAKNRIPDTEVIDGGAYIGDTASLFVRRYSPSKVHAFEPMPESFWTMKRLVSKWGMENEIIPQNLALGEDTGAVKIWGQGVGASAIQKSHLTSDSGLFANMTSIDAYVDEAKISNVGMIKLDIEGAEKSAVKGALKTIKRDRPILIISIYHAPEDFFEIKPLLEEMGLGYSFFLRKLTDDFIKETVLIAVRDEDL